MFKCENCGLIFDEPKEIHENHGEGIWEVMYVCPNCGEGGQIESKPCDICGNDAFESCFCDDCMAVAKESLRVDFGQFPNSKFRDLIDLFTEALDELYVEERSKR